ncbi:MAG: hypothetical protein WCX90_00665 [Thiohalomonadaceae bacterium]
MQKIIYTIAIAKTPGTAVLHAKYMTDIEMIELREAVLRQKHANYTIHNVESKAM